MNLPALAAHTARASSSHRIHLPCHASQTHLGSTKELRLQVSRSPFHHRRRPCGRPLGCGCAAL